MSFKFKLKKRVLLTLPSFCLVVESAHSVKHLGRITVEESDLETDNHASLLGPKRTDGDMREHTATLGVEPATHVALLKDMDELLCLVVARQLGQWQAE